MDLALIYTDISSARRSAKLVHSWSLIISGSRFASCVPVVDDVDIPKVLSVHCD